MKKVTKIHIGTLTLFMLYRELSRYINFIIQNHNIYNKSGIIGAKKWQF